MRRKTPKKRITVSLASETADFLTKYRARTEAASFSACIEELVLAYRRQIERQRIDTQTRAYYDGLSDAERREEVAWGDLSIIELAERGR